jgi:tRNA(adenine34) deaminase
MASAPDCPFEKFFPSLLKKDDLYFMQMAYNQAIEAWKEDEVPIGAVIEVGGEIIAMDHNRTRQTKDPTAHAELLAITAAAQKIGDWRLNEARLFVTKEPCPMCAGASIMARLGHVFYAVSDPKMGCLGGAFALQSLTHLNHALSTSNGLLEKECLELIQTFFQIKRNIK